MSAPTTTRRPGGGPPPSIVQQAPDIASLRRDVTALTRQVQGLAGLGGTVAGLQASIDRLTEIVTAQKPKPAPRPVVVPVQAPESQESEVPPKDADLLYGAAAISAFLGVCKRQGLHLIETNRVPFFRIGRNVCAKRTAQQEAAANG